MSTDTEANHHLQCSPKNFSTLFGHHTNTYISTNWAFLRFSGSHYQISLIL